MGGTIHPGVYIILFHWQWFWGHDYLNNKVKNIYFGPRLDWMKLFKRKEKKNEKSVDRRRNKTSKGIKEEI